MEMKRGICMLLVFATIFAVVVCGSGDNEQINGYSLGQPQILRKDRHLLATDCDASCGRRCAVAGVKDRCLKYCGICCNQCGCVPSGTYGHKEECPCYRDKKNSKGKPKCP